MTHRLFLIASAIILFILEIAFFRWFSGNLALSLLPAFIAFIAINHSKEDSLAAAFIYGFLFDIAAMTRIPYVAIFSVSSVLIIQYLGRKHLRFKSMISMILLASGITFIFSIYNFSIFGAHLFSLIFAESFLSNLILNSLIVALLIGIYNRLKPI